MFQNSKLGLVGLASLAAIVATADAGKVAGVEIRTRAEFAGQGLASGKADYRERSRNNLIEQRFSIEVEDAQPGESFTVSVNGITFGTIVANDLGVAELQFRTAEFIDDPGDGDPIPSEFPRLNAGDVITVGKMMGTFEDR
ncbi:MAG: hypothetical protein ACTS27_05665 [Phycisphaerales bacterium]